MTSEKEMQCYNKGCGLKFNVDENTDDSCCFHPGAPVFHDAYKGWSCCNKKSTDFTTFLHMKGCRKGKHNSIKPEEPEKYKPDPNIKDEIIVVAPPQTFLERPSCDLKMEKIKISVTQSLTDALNNENEKSVIEPSEMNGIQFGESCKNNGCNETYEEEYSNLGICKHHPGIPIFHEGLKFWYCCQRKTTDFDMFLQQEGCASGSHVWVKKNMKKTSCRYDWHQTGSFVVLTVYAKSAHPDGCTVNANPVRLSANIVFGNHEIFEISEELGGVIILNESSVTMAATKIEIQLRKAEPRHWSNLFLIHQKENQKEDKDINDDLDDLQKEALYKDLDAIDISSI